MANSFRFKRPVVILGTPRSGTSLLHRVLRAQPGFVSLPAESEAIWGEYIHPELNNWDCEGWPGSVPNASMISEIHRGLSRHAIGAPVWRRVDTLRMAERGHSRLFPGWIAQFAYHLLTTASSAYRSGTSVRLVEKSVNNALWLELIDRVFPDALYVHIVRKPEDNVHAMARAWLHPDRFFTYKVPVTIRIPGYPWQRWNFALPPGWRDYIDRPLENVVSFQWAALQERLLEFTQNRQECSARLKLENLALRPRTELKRLSEFLGIPWQRHLEEFAISLPRVNADTCDHRVEQAATRIDRHAIRSALDPYAALIRAIGY